jgi:nucleoside-diphosphate-sugar epimerase
MRFERPLPPGDLEHVRLGVAALWPELKGARIFITGGTGFFGRWLIESLLAASERHELGVRLVALSRNPGAFLDAAPHLAGSGIEWVTGSVATLEPEVLAGLGFDMVIHLATEADMQATQANPQAAVGVITDGTRRVLNVAARSGARRFLFTSSGAVYGPQPGDMAKIPETYPGTPDPQDKECAYALPGEAKRQAEALCVRHAKEEGLGAVIARCFTFAGPGLPTGGKFAFGNFMRDGLIGGPIIVRGDGATVRSYLYAADLAVWLWTLLLRGTPGRAYNVGSEKPVTLRELAETISRELGAPGVNVLQQPEPGRAPDRYVPSTKRCRDELGLSESFGLPEMVLRTAAWHRRGGPR